MSLEIEELKAQIIRRYNRRLHSLGITRIELITENTHPDTHQTPQPGLFQRVRNWAGSSILVRVCEVALLMSVLPTILPNFKLNYQKPIDATVACIHSVQSHLETPPATGDPLAPLLPHSSEMSVDHHDFPKPLPIPTTDFTQDLRRPCRARNRITA